jgi:hypothetical protein
VRRSGKAAGIAAANANAASAAAAAAEGGDAQGGPGGGPGALFGGGEGGAGALFREGGQRDSDEAVGTPLSRHGRTPSWSQRLNTLGQRLLGSPRSPNRGGRGQGSPFAPGGAGGGGADDSPAGDLHTMSGTAAHPSTSHLNRGRFCH